MTIELPSWAWLIIAGVNASGFTVIVKMLSYYGGRVDTRLDNLESRANHVESRVSVLEAVIE